MMIAITGATGYIGSRLMAAARDQGYEVLALTRQPPARTDISWERYEIGGSSPILLPPQIEIVFHLAATTNTTDVDIDSELAAARQLISDCRRCGARLVFLSSQAASESAATNYGRSKWMIEQEVVVSGGSVIRPGLVYGGVAQGLFGRLVNLVASIPVLPALWPAPLVQPIHIDDLVKVLLHHACQPFPGSTINCASETPIPFHEFLRSIAESRLRKARVFVPVPSLFVRYLAKVIPRRFCHRIGLARIISLLDMKPMTSCFVAGDLMKPRPLSAGMQDRHFTHRRALWSAKAVLQYLARANPPASLVKRYARAGEVIGNLPDVPDLFLCFPILLCLLDGLVARHIYRKFFNMEKRFSIGVAVLESSALGARRMLPAERDLSAGTAALRLMSLCLKEVAWTLASVLLYPLVRWLLRQNRGQYEA